MFRYIFAFLLLNSSYRSLGVPIPTNKPVSLYDLLAALGTSCENVFLFDQIKSKLEYCSDIPPHGEKHLECLIFYDINKQLCDAIATSKLALTEDYSSKIKEEQDVNLLCGSTKDWVFSNLTEYPRYKTSIEKFLKHPVTCGKICGAEDLMSDDASFFCKYFKWGTDMLKNQVSVATTQNNSAQLPPETGHVENKPVSADSDDLKDVEVKIWTTSKTPNGPLEVATVKNNEPVDTETVKQAASSGNNQVSEPPSSNSAPSEKSEPKPIAAEESLPAAVNSLGAIEQANKPETTNPEVKNAQNNSQITDTMLTKPGVDDLQKWAVDTEGKQNNSELEQKQPVLETPGQSKDKQPNDNDEYQDSEEGKEVLGDIQVEDEGEDPLLDDTNNKPGTLKEGEGQSQHVKTIVSGGEGVSGVYPSFGQYADDDDDGDHFFSFFLTSVIMVVLIYVLYHNKNKLAKVFFGLVLEGRQSGRRRNSRGHSYRRLDTLEQAMSTNTAAPPSKIIY